MDTPRLEVNLNKIANNVRVLGALYGSKGITLCGVTKVVCGNVSIAQVLVNEGIQILADSKIANIKKMHDSGIKAEFLLLGPPMPGQADTIVQYANISLNTELNVIQKLAKSALEKHSTHKIILMVESGDLREGIMPLKLEESIRQVLALKGIKLVGLGTNLACFGGIQPDQKNMDLFSSLVKEMENKFRLRFQYISGGNSSNYDWFVSSENIGMVNNLRIGESIFLGTEPLHRSPIPHLVTDAFTLVSEVTELKTKPSVPYGKKGQNAFGHSPVFKDFGYIPRAIIGMGLQDVMVSGLTPRMDIAILGAGSDHIIIDPKKSGLNVGCEVKFDLNYSALLSAMTSPYVTTNYIL